MISEIESVLNFLVEIEKLKNIHRKTRPVGLERYENSAEHSWHVCMAALMLRDYADNDIDITQVIKMLLVHDLGEIDAGDKIIYESETKAQKDKELAGVERVFKLLPEKLEQECLLLWREFEEGATENARYAKAIDRIPPLLHNLHGNGHSWRENNISADKVFSVNARIEFAGEDIWRVIRKKLEQAVSDGILK